MANASSLSELQLIADALGAGFQSLLDQVEEQKKIEVNLRHHLDHSVEKYENRDKSSTSPSGETSDWRDEIVNQISPSSVPKDISTSPTSNIRIDKAKEALKQLGKATMPSRVERKRCPVTHQTTDQEDFEHDFTTPGRIGDLGCPFAMRPGADHALPEPDPIAEEFYGEKASVGSGASDPVNSRCPIRYLDKHSPEEVAQYFENHKHEVPRSHQICVKRYQQNEQSIRQLDAKYGNLVSMIQGLGQKHKQFLPQNEKVADEPEQDSSKAVEKWAENVSHHAESADEPNRVPRFERPLPDVRVGESPSRPWGISVPVGKSLAASAVPSMNDAQILTKPPSASTGRARASNMAHLDGRSGRSHRSEQKQQSSSSRPQIVFNGPVFFGYPAEQAALFLKSLDLEDGNV